MSGLSEFLLARIAEDEGDARAATQGPWKLWAMDVLADQDGTSNVETAVPVARTYGTVNGRLRTFNADHIARHDPARILAECEAKRRIVELHRIDADPCDAHDASYLSIPCDTLRLLALPYAAHPDYRAEWKP